LKMTCSPSGLIGLIGFDFTCTSEEGERGLYFPGMAANGRIFFKTFMWRESKTVATKPHGVCYGWVKAAIRMRCRMVAR